MERPLSYTFDSWVQAVLHADLRQHPTTDLYIISSWYPFGHFRMADVIVEHSTVQKQMLALFNRAQSPGVGWCLHTFALVING